MFLKGRPLWELLGKIFYFILHKHLVTFRNHLPTILGVLMTTTVLEYTAIMNLLPLNYISLTYLLH